MTLEEKSKSPTWQWIAATLLSLLVGAAGALYAAQNKRIDKLDTDKASTQSVYDMNQRLVRIEDKLDRLLQQRAR